MSDVASIIARRKPRRVTVRLLLDGNMAGRLDELGHQVRRAKTREAANPQGLASPAALLEQEYNQLKVDADEAVTEFVVQAISRATLEELKRAHPPTEEQWERYREQSKDLPVLLAMQLSAPTFDWVGMAPGLLAACAVSPTMTKDEAQLLWDTLSDAEAAQLFRAAWEVNQQTATRPFSGTDTVTTPNFGPNSTTPESTESPSLSLAEGS